MRVIRRWPTRLVAVLVFSLVGTSNTPVVGEGYPSREGIEDTSICHLVGEPSKFADKLVRVHARYAVGYHFGILRDEDCPGVGIVLWSEPGSEGNRRLSAALSRNCRGVLNKELILSMVARYRWNPKKAETGDFPRVLELQQIENMEVHEFPNPKECDGN